MILCGVWVVGWEAHLKKILQIIHSYFNCRKCDFSKTKARKAMLYEMSKCRRGEFVQFLFVYFSFHGFSLIFVSLKITSYVVLDKKM